MCSSEVRVLTAPGDGVGPCAILSLDHTRPAVQYMFRVPDGTSRLGLEQGNRAGLGLRAVFTCNNQCSQGGMPGLLMRLRADGNEQVHVLGPAGTVSELSLLRHVMSWSSPHVLATDISPSSPLGPCFEDDLVAVTPLWVPDAAECAAQSSSSSGSSSSDVSDDSSSTTASDSGTTAESTDETGRSPAAQSSEDASSSSSSSGMANSQEKSLKPGDKDPYHVDKPHQECPVLDSGWTIQHAPKRPRKQEPSQQNLVTSAGKQFQPIAGSTNAKVSLFEQVQSEGSKPAEGHTLTKHLIGWLIWIKRSDDVLVISELESEDDALALKRHPVVAQLPEHRTRLCLLMLGWELSEGLFDSVEQLRKNLPNVRLAPSSSSNLHSTSMASARVTARLALSSSVFFPLPHGLQHKESMPTQASLPAEIIAESCTLRWGLQSEQLEAVAWSKKDDEDDRRATLSVSQVQEQVLQERPGMEEQLRKLRTEQPNLFLERCSLGDEDRGTRGGCGPCTLVQGPAPTKTGTPTSNKSAAAALRAKISLSTSIKSQKPDNVNGDLIEDQSIKRQTGDKAKAQPVPSYQGPVILFLGTGCAEPSKYRAASAILITLESGDCILLDAGEGTVGQLIRTLGFQAAMNTLRRLRLIWVSHRHADHITGVPEVLRAVHEATRCLPDVGNSGIDFPSLPVLLMGPWALKHWLARWIDTEQCSFLHPTALQYPDFEIRSRLLCALGHTHVLLRTVPALHCPDSWSLRLTLPGWSLVYSGDTMPTPALADICRPPTTFLIHEATFGPDMAEEAFRKKHSTVDQVLQLARIVRPQLTLLTHFSQRYPRYPQGVLEKRQDGDPAVAVTFDGMTVPLRKMHLLPAIQRIVADLLDKKEDEVLA